MYQQKHHSIGCDSTPLPFPTPTYTSSHLSLSPPLSLFLSLSHLSFSLDPPHITQSFGSVTQYASLSINVSCVAKGDGLIHWLWRNNSQPLTQSTNTYYTESGSVSFLVIESLDVYSNGTLQCVAYNDDNTLTSSANHNLNVQSKFTLVCLL